MPRLMQRHGQDARVDVERRLNAVAVVHVHVDVGDARSAVYRLDIRPQGGGALSRDAHLELVRLADGTWRVSRFSESNP